MGEFITVSFQFSRVLWQTLLTQTVKTVQTCLDKEKMKGFRNSYAHVSFTIFYYVILGRNEGDNVCELPMKNTEKGY